MSGSDAEARAGHFASARSVPVSIAVILWLRVGWEYVSFTRSGSGLRSPKFSRVSFFRAVISAAPYPSFAACASARYSARRDMALTGNEKSGERSANSAFMITSIAVDDEFVELGVLVAPEYGANPTVRILGCETVNGTYHVRTDATTEDGALYRLPVSDDRFFQAVLGM